MVGDSWITLVTDLSMAPYNTPASLVFFAVIYIIGTIFMFNVVLASLLYSLRQQRLLQYVPNIKAALYDEYVYVIVTVRVSDILFPNACLSPY